MILDMLKEYERGEKDRERERQKEWSVDVVGCLSIRLSGSSSSSVVLMRGL